MIKITGAFKLFLLLGIAALCLFAGSCSTPGPAVSDPGQEDPRRLRANSADPVTLRSAILDIVEEIESAIGLKETTADEGASSRKIPIVVLGIDTSWDRLSDWATEEFTAEFSNRGVLQVVDKRNVDKVREELREQNSGFVSNEMAQRMGQETGAKYIVSGNIYEEGSNFRLRIYLTEIETNVRVATPTRYIVSGDPQIQPYLDAEKEKQALAEARQRAERERQARAEAAAKVEAERREEERRITLERERDSVAWKHKWLYFGVRGGFAYRYYKMSDDDFDPEITKADSALPYEFIAYAALQFLDSLALQVEGIYTYDKVQYTGITGPPAASYHAAFESDSIMIPVLLKWQERFDGFFLALFGGGYYNLPRGKMKYVYSGRTVEYDYSAPVGFILGIDIGFKMGPGVLFLDSRFAMDIGDTSIKDAEGRNLALYNRRMGSFTVGYELGLFQKSNW
ncbi:MAG: penicillin-binding protein activator LpoB [Spirochaetales bacterium]|jgi:TolB-like protein|nr:penicillin-binding protein activator LpoB [Spirochaetales bacterium]